MLGAVDEVFRASGRLCQRHLGRSRDLPQHRPLPDAAPGLVEIWPLTRPQERREIEGWDAPFDALAVTSPQVRLAQRIADTIATPSATASRSAASASR